MPAVSAPALILVTGANGFIALHVTKQLLEQGFSVRGQVRSVSKGKYLKNLFTDAGDRFQFVVVEDLLADGAFDEAVKGVSAVAHVAAPGPKINTHPNDVVKPAVGGTLSLFGSAQKAGGIKRIIITSTYYAAMPPKEGPYQYSEEDWNDAAVDALNQMGSETPPGLVCVASKVLLERAAFDYVKKGNSSFDIVSILPTLVTGAPLNEIHSTDLDARFGSTAIFLKGVTDPENLDDFANPDSYIDIQDTAETYVQSLTHEAASNQRFFSIAGRFSWDVVYTALKNAGYSGIPSTTTRQQSAEPKITFDTTKAEKVLGIKYKSLEESAVSTYEECVKRGWIKGSGTRQ